MVSQAKRPERDALTSIYYHIISCVLKISPEIILIQMVTNFWLLPTLLSSLPTLLHHLPTLLHPSLFISSLFQIAWLYIWAFSNRRLFFRRNQWGHVLLAPPGYSSQRWWQDFSGCYPLTLRIQRWWTAWKEFLWSCCEQAPFDKKSGWNRPSTQNRFEFETYRSTLD